ncbi:MAG: uroporphyrinogen-III C-methyltransferase [Bacteroidota bacterium]
MKSPQLTLVGAGPGDPELLTIKGLKALKKADVVLYDALVHPDLLEEVPIDVPRLFVGKRCGKHSLTQDAINQLIVDSAFKYGHVVRLKGGDPFVFGRGYEEISFAKKAGMTTAVIPGLSSSIAAPAYSGIPLTHRGCANSFWVLTATTKDHQTNQAITHAAQSEATMVILMGTRKLSEIVYLTSEWRRANTPIALLQNVSMPNEQFIFGTLQDIIAKAVEAKFASPGIIVIGEAVKCSDQFMNNVVQQTLGQRVMRA